MTYNTHNAVGLDKVRDFVRIGEVIRAQDPDFVALQELDKGAKRSNGADVLAEIAKAAGMYYEYGPAIDFQGGKYGIGVLSKEKPIKSECVPLPGKSEKRVLLVVEFEKCYFCCSHWELHADDREATAKIIAEKMKSLDKPVFIGGDFNAEPNEKSIQILAKDWKILTPDGATFPADAPDIRIDYLCAADPSGKIGADDWEVLGAAVVDEQVASDHRPVVVDISADVLQ
ncbi:MAG: endonuclease/exonuclease/phosphatase family protein [Thermoguttaceae bacterium]|nr:endonuclease/exonuclease/phosphatase family protein [Thermoguttaceae bacterium]